MLCCPGFPGSFFLFITYSNSSSFSHHWLRRYLSVRPCRCLAYWPVAYKYSLLQTHICILFKDSKFFMHWKNIFYCGVPCGPGFPFQSFYSCVIKRISISIPNAINAALRWRFLGIPPWNLATAWPPGQQYKLRTINYVYAGTSY